MSGRAVRHRRHLASQQPADQSAPFRDGTASNDSRMIKREHAPLFISKRLYLLFETGICRDFLKKLVAASVHHR
jgi:hypothetical protein